ncbi:MAG: putative histidine kinase, classic [Ramlibacter sp.]|uniref:ATP-binding protein n=1 Tax=Ramlibacter sp. TaxID=1917967 RepID=UPI00262478E8|nr:ATP-binding protein [Ramlibacter sp.]MDB5752892.1 putative histidine kinase, classic [Ramlibacter sp.]
MKWHVFPQGPLCSIRRALMLWLLPLFLVVAATSAALSWWSYGRMVDGFMDDQMQQLASSIASHQVTQLPQHTRERVHEWGAYIVQVHAAGGRPELSSVAGFELPLQHGSGFHDAVHEGRRWRTYVVPAAGDGRIVQVAQSGSFRTRLAAERAFTAIAPMLVLLPLAMLVLWLVARAMARALQDIGRQAAQQDEHNLTGLAMDRVPIEIEPLVVSFNALLGRLRDAFATQRRFVQDAAHELRTPVTAIGLQLENLRCDVDCGATSERFGQLEAGVRRAQRVVDQMLRLSRQEAAGADGPAIVDLQTQLRESINTLIALADQRHIDLGLAADAHTAPLTLQCAAGDLRSVLDNLIENAMRYTPEGGVVDVRLLHDQGRMALEVVDTGPGIPPELLPRVFDRFFRVPGNGASGSGLGLAIAQAAARRCGLAVTLRNRDDRSGLIARVEAVGLTAT